MVSPLIRPPIRPPFAPGPGALPPAMPTPPGMGAAPPPGMPVALPPMNMQALQPAPPMAPPPPPAVPSIESDPMALLLALKQLAGVKAPQPEPIYRPGYKPPPKPDPADIRKTGRILHDQNRPWRALIYLTLMWTRQKMTGIFPEDLAERLAGLQEEYISSALTDERNLLVSKGAALKPSFQKKPLRTEDKGFAQRLEDAAVWFRETEQLEHANRGNRPLELDEWAQLIDYGMYVSRDTLNPRNTDCPVRMTLIDPAQVNPVWGVDGLEKVYRVYHESAAEITAAYGDFAPSALAKIKNEVGSVEDDTEFEVTEYWDSWWRCVLIGDTPVLAVTAHEYGENPYTIQYGGYGEPMFTRTPGEMALRRTSGQAFTIEGTRSDDRTSKATPYLYSRMRSHEIMEAVGARLLTAMKKDVNPPTVRYRDNDAAEKPMEPLYTGPGAQNEAMLGQEKIEPLPTSNSGNLDRVLSMVTTDASRGGPPAQMFGQIDKSNVTGVAQAGANDAGMHLLFPPTKAWEMALSLRYPKIFRLVANFGEDVAYGNGAPKPLMIPVSRMPKPGQPPAYELNREVLDRVGPRITVSFTKVDPRDWAAMMAGGGPGIDKGVLKRSDLRAIMTGDHDFDRFAEEWGEENALFGAQQMPEFQKLNVMAQIIEQIKANEGRPDIQAHYQSMLQMWQQAIAPPPQPPAPMGGPPGMGQPQGGPPLPNPGTSAGISYPGMGQPPGLNGGQVGAPQGIRTDVGP